MINNVELYFHPYTHLRLALLYLFQDQNLYYLICGKPLYDVANGYNKNCKDNTRNHETIKMYAYVMT